MPKLLPLSVAAVILSAAACAPAPQWYHPTKPPSLWAADKAECQSRANRLAERELTYSQDSAINQSQSRLQQEFSTFDAAKRRKSFYAICMKDKGYTDQPPPSSKSGQDK